MKSLVLKQIFILSLWAFSMNVLAKDNSEYIAEILTALNLPTDISKDATYILNSPAGNCETKVEVVVTSWHPRLTVTVDGNLINIYKKLPDACEGRWVSDSELPKYSSCIYKYDGILSMQTREKSKTNADMEIITSGDLAKIVLTRNSRMWDLILKRTSCTVSVN